MKILNRKISLAKIPFRAYEALKMLPNSFAFKHPFQIWRAYVNRQALVDRVVQFRDGYQAWLSDNPDDVITLMVNFAKREYGEVNPGAFVIDIGANIGMYSLFACRCKAAKLIAIEPNPQAHVALSRNLSQSLIKTDTQILQLAVAATSGQTVYMSHNSSPYNKIVESPTNQSQAISVQTISLDDIIKLCDGRRIDYLKIDCEGAEWDIFSQCSDYALSQIDRIRMELHPKRDRSKSEIINRLLRVGFRLVHSRQLIVWLDR